MSLALIAALPFLGALLPGLMIRAGRDACAAMAGAVTALALLGIGLHAPAVLRGEVVATRIEWLPALGLDATFRLDGLGLLFAGLILGIGLLVILYARFYLAKADPVGTFFTYLLLFQGAMTGIVLSDNVLLLLIFWEMTSLASFLLIGYWRHSAEARQGARMALAVTGTGGLAMIAGMLILGSIAGSYDLSVILTRGDAIRADPLYLPALILILLGCFTKSAQFPFHFWLPRAMAAPTPVSAYLHSATMVKAGVFLMARLWPVLSGTPEWFYIVATAGLLTMVLGAVIGLFQHDLKGLLAYSTVSQLGFMTMLLGFGTPSAAMVAVFQVINHATFKAALFMAAGIVDHEAHTRDIRRLGGLRRLMPVTFALTTLGALAMAGIPPLNGYLSKELMLKEVARTDWAGSPWVLPALAVLGAAFSAAYSFRLVAHVFLGPRRDDGPARPHDPGAGLWAAPAILVALALAIGVMPMTTAAWLIDAATSATTGAPYAADIYHWPGLGAAALWMSLGAVGGGLVLLGLFGPLLRGWDAMPRPDAKRIFDGLVAGLTAPARALTAALHDGALTRYLAIAVAAILGAGLWAFLTGVHGAGARAPLPTPVPVLGGWLVLVAATLAVVALHRNRIVALMLVGAIGLMVSVTFAYLSAPDLALTQVSVEVASVLLLLLALTFLPAATPAESGAGRRWRDGLIAAGAGLGAGGLIYALMARDFAFPGISAWHLANSKTEGGGNNVVNVILVDFRGYDTYGEIIVLGIAALVIYALTEAMLRPGPAADRIAAAGPRHGRAGDRHPLMLVVATRVLLPIALMVGVFFFLRGHNLPGGGFIAGLVVGIAILMQYMASGQTWTAARQRIDYHALIGWGVIVAGLSGVGSWFAGLPFLTSGFEYVTIWPLETFELATAMVFDLGVFLTVLGAVLLALASISRLQLRGGERANTAPFGVASDLEPRA